MNNIIKATPHCPVPRAERIARLNDQLRTTAVGGAIVVTRGVRNLSDYSFQELFEALRSYDQFDEDNDPHGERDFGDIDLWDAELLWKIDYLSPDMQFGSNDPADPYVTQRLLTVLLAEEY